METGEGTDDNATAVAQSSSGVKDNNRNLKVMVGTDESDGSFYALNWTVDHFFSSYNRQPSLGRGSVPTAAAEEEEPAADSESGMIMLVHVLQPYHPFVYPPDQAVKKAQRANATAIIDRALQICKDSKVKAETLILEGDPKDKICQAAEELHVDLLVLSSRGLGMIERAFLGSVSDYCAHHVHCPILIVKPPPPSQEEAHSK